MIMPAAGEVKKFYTYDDYLKIDDGNRYELIDGELVLTPSPGTLQSNIRPARRGFRRTGKKQYFSTGYSVHKQGAYWHY